MKFSFYTLILATYVGDTSPRKMKTHVSQNFKLMTDVAEFLKIKFLVIFPLENMDNSLQPLLALLTTTRLYFSVCYAKNFQAMQFPPFKTMAVYIPNREKCCPDLAFVSNYPQVIWLVLNNNSNLNLSNAYLPLNSQFLVAALNYFERRAVITELYQFRSESKIYSQTLGHWDYENGLNVTQASFFQRRSDFHGETILIVPYILIRAGAAGESIPDFIPNVWDSIRKRINATSKKTTNNSVFDVLVNFYLPKETQELPVMLRVKSVLFYKEDTRDFNESSFLDPFRFRVWVSILSWMVLSSLGMLIISQFLCPIKGNYSHYLLDSFYIMVQQGTQIAENALPFLTVKTSQLALSLFLFICYGSVLISFVTVSEYQVPFSDLQGIFQDGRYNILAQPTRGYDAFKDSRPGVVRDLFVKQMTPLEKQPKTFYQSFGILCEGKEKVLVECALQLGPFVVNALAKPCRVNHVPFAILKMGFQMPPRHPFKEIITVCVTKLLESEAIGEIFWEKSLSLTPNKKEAEEDFSGITIEQVSTLFILFIAGIFLSALGLILELSWCTTSQTRKPKRASNFHRRYFNQLTRNYP